MNARGQTTSEFILIMALLLGIGIYLTKQMLGQRQAIPAAQENTIQKIVADGMEK